MKTYYRVLSACFTLSLCFGLIPSTALAEPEGVRINQIQLLATHNSYHLRPDTDWWEKTRQRNKRLNEWDYSHPPLDVQLDRGVRSFEIDVYNMDGEFKVQHVPVLDNRTTGDLMRDCLQTIWTWSESRPRHLPIITIFEIKDRAFGGGDAAKVAPFKFDDLMRMDKIIADVFPRERIITPDDVRGEHETLEAAVLAGEWPLLSESRGKHMLVLMNRDKRPAYRDGAPSLEGRMMFTRSEPGEADAAFLLRNYPDTEAIRSVVEQGYMVRTRADSSLRTSIERRDRAFASGAQIVTSDFPPGEPQPETGYVLEFTEPHAGRCNPVSYELECWLAE